MRGILSVLGVIAVVILMIAGLSIIMAFPTKWLWNWLMPDLFGLKTITVLQAFGLNLLCGILFKSTNNNSNKKD